MHTSAHHPPTVGRVKDAENFYPRDLVDQGWFRLHHFMAEIESRMRDAGTERDDMELLLLIIITYSVPR